MPETFDIKALEKRMDGALAALKTEFDENLVTRRADGTQLWGSDLMGTWTVLLERADNTNCVIASGIGYQDGVDPGAFYAKVGLI